MIPRFEDHPEHIDQLIQSALSAADPAAAVRNNLQKNSHSLQIREYKYRLDNGRIYLLSIGKAAVAMGAAAARILGDSLSEGIVISKANDDESESTPLHTNLSTRVRIFQASHPVSDERGVEATAMAISLVEKSESSDLVLCLISGGASALFTKPRIPLADWQRLVAILLGSGCTINELNAIRKQLDMIKGGGLARIAAPATCVSLILSDVVGNPLDVIGSGPTVPNPDNPATARHLLAHYNIQAKLQPEEWQRIEEQLQAIESSTTQVTSTVYNFVIGDVRQAAMAAKNKAADLGFESKILTANLEGEAREVGRVVAALAKDAPSGSCLILGGETTVTLRGTGLGGRNQELALSAAIALEGWDKLALACFATDGDDGPTDAAGAVITGETASRATSYNLDPLDYLERNDSYHLFERVGGLLLTGQTGTNVNDLIFILKYRH